jgi:NADH:ubiquinone oxidoreductase subunit C
MNKTELVQLLKILLKDCDISEGRQFAEVTLTPEKLHDTAKELRENSAVLFDFLFCLTGVDYGKDLGVVYHLRSTKFDHTVVLKTKTTDRSNPELDSVTDIWKTADYHEREVYDLLGIKFRNHPDLRRLFLGKSWGFPLRKDYVDDINIVTKK